VSPENLFEAVGLRLSAIWPVYLCLLILLRAAVSPQAPQKKAPRFQVAARRHGALPIASAWNQRARGGKTELLAVLAVLCLPLLPPGPARISPMPRSAHRLPTARRWGGLRVGEPALGKPFPLVPLAFCAPLETGWALPLMIGCLCRRPARTGAQGWPRRAILLKMLSNKSGPVQPIAPLLLSGRGVQMPVRRSTAVSTSSISWRMASDAGCEARLCYGTVVVRPVSHSDPDSGDVTGSGPW